MKQEMGGCDDGMEKRIAAIEQDVAVIKSNYVTKADLTASVNNLIKWIVGTAIVLGASGITAMTFVLNNATLRVAATQQPIVIYPQPAISPPAAGR